MTTTMPRPTSTTGRDESGARSPDRWRSSRPDVRASGAAVGEALAGEAHHRVVVGWSGSSASIAALRWAARTVGDAASILVVHATSVPVTVRNGPSAVVAERLGAPEWATAHTMVCTLVDPGRADTLVAHGRPIDVLRHHAAEADLVVIGHGRGRRRLFRRLVEAVPGVVVSVRPDDRTTAMAPVPA